MLKKDKPLYGVNRDRPDSICQNKALGIHFNELQSAYAGIEHLLKPKNVSQKGH
jgi:hypothetical protein